jgi:hypothetical protein
MEKDGRQRKSVLFEAANFSYKLLYFFSTMRPIIFNKFSEISYTIGQEGSDSGRLDNDGHWAINADFKARRQKRVKPCDKIWMGRK